MIREVDFLVYQQYATLYFCIKKNHFREIKFQTHTICIINKILFSLNPYKHCFTEQSNRAAKDNSKNKFGITKKIFPSLHHKIIS